jgi:hypothetical protein
MRNLSPTPPTPAEISTCLRTSKTQFTKFADKMVRAVHGKIRYGESAGKQLFDDLVSPSQEAFTLLLYENGYQTWVWMHDEAVSSSGASDGEGGSDGCPEYLYTKRTRELTSRNGGWSRAGMVKFNEIYKLVRENRILDNGNFSMEYREHWLQKTNRKRKRRRSEKDGYKILKISDDLGDLTGALLDGSGNGEGAEGEYANSVPV